MTHPLTRVPVSCRTALAAPATFTPALHDALPILRLPPFPNRNVPESNDTVPVPVAPKLPVEAVGVPAPSRLRVPDRAMTRPKSSHVDWMELVSCPATFCTVPVLLNLASEQVSWMA